MRPCVLVLQVVDVAGRDERKPRLAGERDELRVDALLDLEPGVLELDVRVVAAEDLRQPVEVGGGSRGRFSSSAFATRPERQPDRATIPRPCRSRSSQSTRGL